MNAQVVVTAAGVISPVGAGLGEFGCALFSGKTFAAPSPRFPGLTTVEIGDFQPQPWLGSKGIRVLDRSARLLSVAARMALTGAGFSEESAEADEAELGLVCGTLFGGLHSITSFDWSGLMDGPALVNPMEFANTVINAPAGQAAIKHRLRGVNSTVCSGLASGLHAIQYAVDFLRFGRAKALLAGGVEELCEESVLGLQKMGANSTAGCAKPFAEDRDGVVPGEASALWMLETQESAESRGRKGLFKLCGFGSAQSAHRIDAFDLRGPGAEEAMRQALAYAGIAPGDVACIVASASGSRVGDEMERRAIERVFGSEFGDVPVCAPKAVFGEAMGASGALCALTAGLALQEQSLPPTPYWSSSPTPINGEYALINAFGCDGNNASMVIQLCRN